MNRTLINSLMAAAWFAAPGICQPGPATSQSVPLYQITVTQRSVDAIDYQYRSGPTKIDFRGTVLLSHATGEATVESHRGRTEIDAKLENLVPPTRFGREYLTYVLWAISPDGAPHNLGEIIPDGSNRARLRVTTDLQVFGLIATAEPHSSVRQPSDVVVLENEIRPDTLGRAKPIEAKYELMPRGHYTYHVQDSLESGVNNAPKVSMDQYEAILEVYQAQNAIGIARAAHADRYAPNTLAKAEQALADAQRLQATKANSRLIVENARAAAESAEDARAIAERRQKDEELATARTDALRAQQAQAQAEAAAQQARAEADAARARLEAERGKVEAERAARERAEADAALARQRAEETHADRIQPSPAVAVSPQPSPQAAQTELRVRFLERLNGVLTTRDTPRGLVVTVADAGFAGNAIRPQVSEALKRLAGILAAQPGLHIAVEGYTDSSQTEEMAARRGAATADTLVASGLVASAVSSTGLGNAHPLESNATETGRLENRRVEIVIAGEPIGALPYWDRRYPLKPGK